MFQTTKLSLLFALAVGLSLSVFIKEALTQQQFTLAGC